MVTLRLYPTLDYTKIMSSNQTYIAKTSFIITDGLDDTIYKFRICVCAD